MKACQNCELPLNNRDFDIGICPNCEFDLSLQMEEEYEPLDLDFDDELHFQYEEEVDGERVSRYNDLHIGRETLDRIVHDLEDK